MKNISCYKTEIAGYSIELLQSTRKPKTFTVVYGLQLDTDLDYSEAAVMLGGAIMHAVACEGNLDNGDDTP